MKNEPVHFPDSVAAARPRLPAAAPRASRAPTQGFGFSEARSLRRFSGRDPVRLRRFREPGPSYFLTLMTVTVMATMTNSAAQMSNTTIAICHQARPYSTIEPGATPCMALEFATM